MKRTILLGTLAVASVGAQTITLKMPPASTPLSASVVLEDPQGQTLGSAVLTQSGMGVKLSVRVSGLTPGMHGMHVHDLGRCVPGVDAAKNEIVAFGGAGGHFDPAKSGNHDSPMADNKYGHGGDLPMITVGADGTGTLETVSDKISLTGVNGILNRSLIVHAMADDYKSDPSGLTGALERCGVIARENFNTRDYALPGPSDYPEGVAYNARKGVLYTGSAANGTIYAINASSGVVSLFSPGGAKGRTSALGLKVDATGRVWVAGGATGTVNILSPDGAPVATLETPKSPSAYLNDLVPAPDGNVYVTDSTRPVIFRVTPDLKIAPWLELDRTPIVYGPGLNLNGIVATPDGKYLLSIQYNTGELWRIDLKTRAVRKVMGGLENGDGLLLDGRTLYVVRNKNGVVSKVMLSADHSSGRVTMEEPLAGLRFHTTLTAVGGDLVVTQGQLDKLQGGTPETPFKLTRFKKF